MNKTLIQVVIGLVVAVALLMLVCCDEEGEQWPKVEATRSE